MKENTVYKREIVFVILQNYWSLSEAIRKNWNDTEKISMAPAQG